MGGACDNASCKQNRTNVCDNPAKSGNGADCPGNSIEFQRCADDSACDVDGGWSNTGAWGECYTPSCKQNRTNVCNNPAPSGAGADCPGNAIELKDCEDDSGC